MIPFLFFIVTMKFGIKVTYYNDEFVFSKWRYLKAAFKCPTELTVLNENNQNWFIYSVQIFYYKFPSV